MGLPQPTKIDFSNVDSLTPAQANAIGENLNFLAAKVVDADTAVPADKYHLAITNGTLTLVME